MAKIDIDTVKRILQRNNVEIRKVAEIMEDLSTELDLQAAEKEAKPPPVKKQFVILVSDPEGHLVQRDFTGWVLQIPEEDSALTTVEKLCAAAYDFNASPKGRRLPLQTLGETLEIIPGKFTKEHQVWIKTKEPVLLVRTDNQIPREPPSE